MTAAIPKQLPLGLPLHVRTVMVTVETVRAALHVDAQTVWDWIDDGTIYHAWDISATPGGPTAQRELRIWMRDVLILADELRTVSKPTIATRQFPAGLQPDVVDAIIGTQRGRLSAVELTYALCCSRQHIHNLWRAGSLTGARVSHSLYIDRPSFVRFLEARLCQ